MNYPIILQPAATGQFCITRGRKNKKTGVSELVAFARLFGLGLKQIREDVTANIGGHHYEPDLAYIDEAKGIYVDIEIDEPYSGHHRPTHYLTADGTPKDNYRNQMFRNAGWHVIRFTEQQMFCQTKSCLKVVYDLLLQLGAVDAIPKKLSDAPELTAEPCRTAEESKDKSYHRHRRTYLGFEPGRMDLKGLLRCCTLLFPVLFQSLKSKRVRKMMVHQTFGYICHK